MPYQNHTNGLISTSGNPERELSERSKNHRPVSQTRSAPRLATAIAGVLLGLTALLPGALWADENTGRHGPHLNGPSGNANLNSLRIGFRDPAWSFADEAHTCGDGCFSVSPESVRYVPQLRSAYHARETSLNLGQSGPVSWRFNGSRLKMQVRF